MRRISGVVPIGGWITKAMTKSELSLERRISRLETLVWVLVALNLPEVLVFTEILV